MNDFINRVTPYLIFITAIGSTIAVIYRGSIFVIKVTKKILQLLKQNSKELIMKKNVKKTTAKKRDNGLTGKFRDKTRGRISVHAFSCHDDVWQEMEAEKLKRNMSVGQYLNFLHDYYKQNEAKNRA